MFYSYYRVFKVELAGPALDDDDELDTVCLVKRAPALLMKVGVAKIPSERVKNSEVVPATRTVQW